ncbi:hypothetical protein PIROE2DRAFT_16702 [Piromyces sp. E2]|nr:hypothetical protein PIROE2DRAFT_16702 [Piromyces sp. E2]|eukprot:OUM58120.1 hypothetical protein PIROE2DRAFT_16702 [Piromyces sp. E2]
MDILNHIISSIEKKEVVDIILEEITSNDIKRVFELLNEKIEIISNEEIENKINILESFNKKWITIIRRDSL